MTIPTDVVAQLVALDLKSSDCLVALAHDISRRPHEFTDDALSVLLPAMLYINGHIAMRTSILRTVYEENGEIIPTKESH